MAQKFPVYRQLETMDCGPVCLRMVAKFYGKSFSLDYLKEITFFSRTGVSLQSIIDASERIGIETMAVRISMDELFAEAPKPAILHWNKNHFVVLPPQQIRNAQQKIIIADPEHGKVSIPQEAFKAKWCDENGNGVALLLHPTEAFRDVPEVLPVNGFAFLKRYLLQHKGALIKVMLSLAATSGISLLFPLLTQALVDKGIASKSRHLVLLILLGQLGLFVGSILMDLARSWWLMHMNTKINITLVSDFLLKLTRLPLKFFDARRVGDIQQRILDHGRIEQFLSGHTLGSLFSFVNLIVFSFILAHYNLWILLLFIIMSGLSIGWIFLFLKKRKMLDAVQFALNSKNQNMLNELVTGMPEIKLNLAEEWQQKSWKEIQLDLYKRNVQSLKLAQYQQIGATFFTQLKNILTTFVSALLVIKGEMTLGMMLAVSFIIGQMNSPLDQLLGLVELSQDAKLSLERLAEVHSRTEEDISGPEAVTPDLPPGDMQLEQLSFKYDRDLVLKNINCTIRRGKVTAIVGASGSGKTTLLKLLLQFYKAQEGTLKLGGQLLNEVPVKTWRKATGVVMQDGFIFSDTLRKNIALSDEHEDKGRFEAALRIANLEEFVRKLPLGADTQIGINGVGLSMGQKQRILIARAIYKDPEFIFFDEATSSLDAKNEKEIMLQLQEFYRNKTVVVIAHRLSTVKHADHIIVLHEGEIVEAGKHSELVSFKGRYYTLVKNQLELDS